MRAVIQRVSQARVLVAGKTISQIGHGLVVLIGIEKGDTEKAAHALAEKLAVLRIFPDHNHKMNRDINQAGGTVLSISQFTLLGSVMNGRRPDFFKAEEPVRALQLYQYFNRCLQAHVPVMTGEFGAHMQVELVNDGPVTFVVDIASSGE
jgi:D-aminoacyl-tRNA deacylase